MNILTDLRPKSLTELLGQSAQGIQAIQTRVAGYGVPHTVLLHGPSGCGKTTIARILLEIAGGRGAGGVQVKDHDAASENGVEAARELVAIAGVRPLSGVRGVIMDECHRMSKEAQDALLKSTEEPPDYMYWMLCTTEPGKLNKTLFSRAFKIEVEGLSKGAEIEALITKALNHLEVAGDARALAEKFLAVGITAPRAILEATEAVAMGNKVGVPTGAAADAFNAVRAYYAGKSGAALAYFRDTDTNGIVSWQFIAANYGASMVKAGSANGATLSKLMRILEPYPDEAVLRAAWIVAKVAGA